MYSGGGDGGASAAEKARQQRVDLGMHQINQIFEGGAYGVDPAATYSRGTTYYDAQGNVWTPPAGTDAEAATRQAIREGSLFLGRDEAQGFGDKFYADRKKAFLEYNTPQMMDSYRGTKNNLAYALARNGLRASSTAIERGRSLDKELNKNQTTLANAAQSDVNSLRSQVQDARTNLTNELIASGDPSLVTSQAASATAGLRAPSALQPLGNLFRDWADTYVTNMTARAYDPGVNSIWKQMGFGTGASTNPSQSITR